MKRNEVQRDHKIARFLSSNLFLFSFLLLGSVLLLFIVFAIMNMAIKQIAFNFDNFVAAILDQYVIETIILTFYSAFVATLITIGFGTPLSYLLAKYKFRGKSFIESIINVPMMIPHSVAGLLIFSLFHREGLLGAPFREIGLVFEDSIYGIIVALLFVSMPIYINNTRDGFKSINPHLACVAKSLGATDGRVFSRILLPLNKRHIVTGAVLCWARGISEFGAVILITYYPMIAPILIYYRFNTQGLEGSSPIALLLIIICFLIFAAIHLLTREKRLDGVVRH